MPPSNRFARGHRGRTGLAIAVLAGLAACVMLAPVAFAGAAPSSVVTSCRAKNIATKAVYADLQSAINAASAGDTLQVKGTCYGNFSIHRSLNLAGSGTKNVPHATLNGNASGTVLSVSQERSVRIRNLTLTNGLGGGIYNNGTLTLTGSTSVSGNIGIPGDRGGGITNDGTLTLAGSTSVSGNFVGNVTAPTGGGGILNRGTLTLDELASVNGNTGDFGGGIYNDGSITLEGSSAVTGNMAALDDGGGIYNDTGGTIILAGSSAVTGNTAHGAGGGIYNGATLDACITWTGAISPNTPDDPPTPTTIVC